MLILFLFVIGVFYVQFYLYKRRLTKNITHLPVAKGLPLVGICHRFIGKSTTEIYHELIKLSETYQNPSIAWFCSTLIIVISSAEDMQIVLNSPDCLQKAHLYDNLAVNDGIFKSKAHIWKQHRKLLNPTFNHKILTSFIPIFNEKSKIMADKLKQMLNQENLFDISKPFFACTLDTVCATSLGANFDFQKEKNCDILESMEKYSEMAAERLVKVWLHWDFIYKWSNLCKVQSKMLKIFETLPKEIFRVKQKEFYEAKSNSNQDLDESEEFKEPQIFVNELLRLQSKGLFDDKVVYDQIVTMVVGGNETTALTSSHVILMLAMHQDIQERVFQEIKSAHADQYCDTDAEAMTKMHYLEMVIRETMRMLPVGPFLGRETLADVKISMSWVIAQYPKELCCY
ncbi:cytochrome P450 4d1-like isoform X2 [Bradysia coprophila]|uniref:cytochrome P450 4d1-like isoform X2 n=1 Tax=Bradysia coprophila TaxID=38358 RepID=UPI00187DAF78|nr:cytochrome P450 4d1-like isoform X2 [Bradysia coprophila]